MNFILKDWHWKILSIAVAFLFWMWWTSEESIVQFHEVPLKIQNMSSSFDISGEFVNSVTLTVKGPGQTLGKMKSSDLDVKLDLSGAKLGVNTIPLQSENVKLPFGTVLEKITPPLIVMKIERKERKTVRIVPVISGTVAEGFVYDGYEASPGTVYIEGPESQVRATESASTETIDISGKRESFSVEVNVFIESSEVRLEKNLKKVVVRVIIREKDISVNINSVPLELRFQKYKTAINPSSINVVLHGAPSVLKSIDKNEINVFLDLTGLDPQDRDYLVEPQIKFSNPALKNKVKAFSFSQRRVNVKIYDQIIN